MAEFTEVMRQMKRMCAAHGGMCKIRNCPMVNGEACRFAADQDDVDYNEVERIIMVWAAEHPAPRYPTWNEWQQKMFPDAEGEMSPCEFGNRDRFNCEGKTCDECRGQQIPADIAAKLGIKPVTADCSNCKYTDKYEYEEPCVRCRQTQAEGSARWAEMPDLWEEG